MKLKTNLSIIVCSIQKSPAKRKNSGNRWNERNILILIYHKISLNKQGSLLEWVVPEKIHTPPTDGILEILAGGGVKDSGNPGGRGG